MKLFVELISKIASLWIITVILPGFTITDNVALVTAAIVIGVINMFIRPVLQFIALPITIFSLGIFAFIVNASLIWIASLIVPGFSIDSFLTAIIASVLMALLGAFFQNLNKNEK
jgi:putative membrane protein